MKKKRIISEYVGEPPEETWSNCLVIGDHVHIAGMTARGGDFGDVDEIGVYEQTKAIFTKIKHLMEKAGGQIDDVVRVTIYVTDIRERDEVWRARREFFTGDFPVSALIEISKLATPGMKVEVEATAILGAGG
jgi:enamine deaminase RidA (YjgF/YER057c/UK114 family)